MLSGVPGSVPAVSGTGAGKSSCMCFLKYKKYEKNMNFVLKPPGPVLRRLILKKVYDKIKTVICKQTTLRKAYLYIGE